MQLARHSYGSSPTPEVVTHPASTWQVPCPRTAHVDVVSEPGIDDGDLRGEDRHHDPVRIAGAQIKDETHAVLPPDANQPFNPLSVDRLVDAPSDGDGDENMDVAMLLMMRIMILIVMMLLITMTTTKVMGESEQDCCC
jgi:hypothetical protein